ncbi:MAG TPA: phosphodiester glycosidase family protein [Propionibacteriaceae bacterium]|nr:phosphodiester glycosidase family protein [Propionibacteriaceae bacterium]
MSSDEKQTSVPRRDVGRRPSRSRRFRTIRTAAIAVVALLVVATTASVAPALTAPGTDSTAARLAEWGRDHGLGWAVTALEQVQYSHTAPTVGGTIEGGLPTASSQTSVQGSPSRTSKATTAAPAALAPLVDPAVPGEGAWRDLYAVNGVTAARAASLRPDAEHTGYYVQVVWMDPKLVRFALHPGYKVPGPGLTPENRLTPDELDSVLATFNSGFLMTDARGGYWQNGQSIVPLRAGAASMVLTADGRLHVEAWPGGTPGSDVTAVRQNLDMVIENGAMSPAVSQASAAVWGKTVGNAAYVWRSGIGVRADGSVVFVVGPAMTIQTLAAVLQDAGAVNAMELDINPDWTNYITYTHPAPGNAAPAVLPPPNPSVSPSRYLQPSSRDFVAVLPR